MATQQLLFQLPAPTGTKVSKRKPPEVPRIKVDHELARERYYLQRRIRKYFPYDGHLRLVDVSPYRTIEEIPKKPRKYIERLIELGYNIQLAIPCPKPTAALKPQKRKKTLTVLTT